MTKPPCPTCGEGMKVSPDKKGKPYLRCSPCGVQVFIRAERGVDLFESKYGTDWRGAAPAPVEAPKPPPAAASTTTATPAAAPATTKKKGALDGFLD